MTRFLTCVLIAIGLTLVGCGGEDDTSTPAAGSGPSGSGGDSTMDSMKQAAEDVTEAAKEMKEDAEKAAADAKAAVEKAAADAEKAAADAKAAAEKAAADAQAAADAAAKKGQELLDQLMQLINDNKLDEADATFSELNGIKDALPDGMQGQVDNAGTALEAKKATSGGTDAINNLMK